MAGSRLRVGEKEGSHLGIPIPNHLNHVPALISRTLATFQSKFTPNIRPKKGIQIL
jgi:hypothetical protein